ncbi:hypothetical protein [Anaplasma phagocytophilum]|nr:hypothetical protein [Anaplasma phagocytophilum]
MFSLTTFCEILVINTIRQGLLEEDSRTFVFNEGPKRVSDSDVRVAAE